MSNIKEKVPINWHFTCQLTGIYEKLNSYISEANKIQVDCLKDSRSDSYDKNNIKEKLNDLSRLHKAMHEKIKQASYSEQIQKVGGIIAKPAPKKGKSITTETLHLVTIVYEDDNVSRHVPKKKDYASVSKGVHKQKLGNLQKSL